MVSSRAEYTCTCHVHTDMLMFVAHTHTHTHTHNFRKMRRLKLRNSLWRSELHYRKCISTLASTTCVIFISAVIQRPLWLQTGTHPYKRWESVSSPGPCFCIASKKYLDEDLVLTSHCTCYEPCCNNAGQWAQEPQTQDGGSQARTATGKQSPHWGQLIL